MAGDHLFRVGKIWYGWAYSASGKQSRFSLRTPSKDIARQRLAAKERAMDGRDLDAPPPSHTVEQALQYFLDHGLGGLSENTGAFYAAKTGVLNRLIGAIEVQDLTVGIMTNYIERRIAEGVSHHTINKELVTLRQALKLARKRKELRLKLDLPELLPHYDPHYRPRTRRLTTVEAEKLLRHLKPNRRLWLMIAVWGGGRLSEVNGLQWSDVDLVGGWITWGTKTPKSHRTVPLHPQLIRELDALPDRTGYVCQWKNPSHGLAYACRQLGLPHASPNDLRRTFVSWMKESGQDTFVVAKLVGHGSSKMIDQVYGHLTDARYRDAVRSLPEVGYGPDRKKQVHRTKRKKQNLPKSQKP